MNVQACMKDNNEKIFDEQQISLLTKAPPKDTAALDKRSVLAKANSKGSGRYKPSTGQIPKVGENDEWKDDQKKDTNKTASEKTKIRKTRNKTIQNTSTFL